MIEFIQKENQQPKPPTLADVKSNQFFISKDGWLCQKRTSTSYIIIANYKNSPFADYSYDVNVDMVIGKVLPEIEFIKF